MAEDSRAGADRHLRRTAKVSWKAQHNKDFSSGDQMGWSLRVIQPPTNLKMTSAVP